MKEFLGRHKRSLLLSLLIGALAFGLLQSVSYLLDKYRHRPAWPLIPAGAIAVMEIRDMPAQWRMLRGSPALEMLQAVPFFNRLYRQAVKLDSAADYARLLGNTTVYISFHLTAKNDFDAVFYIPAENLAEADLEKLRLLFVDFEPLPRETRIYQGETLYELTDRTRSRIFTFFMTGGYWAGSFTPYLIEDVVRTYNSPWRNNFQSAHPNLFAARQLTADSPVRFYLNTQKLKDWAGVFAELKDAALLEQLTDDLLLSFNIEKNAWLLTGATANADTKRFTHFLKGNPPVSLHAAAACLPAETAYVYALTVADGSLLYHQLRQYWTQCQPEQINAADSLINKTDLDAEAFFELLNDGVVFAASELAPDGQADYWVSAGMKDSRKALRILEQAAREVLPNPQDTLFTERYGRFRIVELPLPELPRLLFGAGFGGFARVFATADKDRLIFGNRLAGLKRCLDALESGDTWASPEKQYLLAGMDSAAHISFIVHHKRNWTRQQSYLTAQAEAIATAYLRQWLFFTHFSCRLIGKPQGHFAAQIILGHGQAKSRQGQPPVKLWETDVGSPLREPPQPVVNHNTRALELIFQDQNNNLHLVSAEGKKLWSLPLGSAVTDGYRQIDYFNNGKLQYLLTTANSVYLIDRLGRVVNGFPITHPWGGILDKIGIIDYDNTKDYRLAVTTLNGDIFLMNKIGQVLQGWSPRKTTGAPAAPLQHIRTPSRDCMLAVQENGGIMLMKRNGESYPGFPVALQKDVFPSVIVETAADFDNYAVRVLTENGELMKINFQGRILAREPHYDDAGGGQFSLCKDALGSNRCIVARQVNNRLTISDINGKVLFQTLLTDETPHQVQFFGFGAGSDVVAITNPKSEQCRLYLVNGDLLTATPLPTRLPVWVRLNEPKRTLQVFTTRQNKLQAWEVAL